MEQNSEIWRHVKTGGLYIVIEWDARDAEQAKQTVVHSNILNGQVWVCSYSDFMDRFVCVPRDQIEKWMQP